MAPSRSKSGRTSAWRCGVTCLWRVCVAKVFAQSAHRTAGTIKSRAGCPANRLNVSSRKTSSSLIGSGPELRASGLKSKLRRMRRSSREWVSSRFMETSTLVSKTTQRAARDGRSWEVRLRHGLPRTNPTSDGP